ncbi:glycosyltransferase family 2 protein [Jannaschia seohaensis]|uniref:Glycosyl transferase family 2 n=1 Tax=Jannaschia seohaensis TaxID=475081 RepID=A0A2Y9A843_9RHOB|nr:glycosyltransferase family 2 protein [Jannaschia seohaensis]PWJ22079.1 glycosyl transferase family 2 [Jannaschia seohaensis]SSA38357.1 Glycosyl transferase family 2 [Jannaschia seohaensis]
MSDWHVVSMVSEPPQLVLAFVAHWLDRGAGHVHLHLDAPDPALMARLGAVSGCSVTVLDAGYWQGDRPARQVDRQRAMLQHVYDAGPAEWLLHVDADEALHPEVELRTILRRARPGLRKLRLGVAERVHAGRVNPDDIFDGVFRRPTPAALAGRVAEIDGSAARYLEAGMTGYASHKSLTRTGLGVTVGVHGAKAAGKGLLLEGALLHFDGMTPRNWTQKRHRVMAQQLACHANGPMERRAQFRHLLRHGDVEGALYRRLKVLSPERMAALDALGLIQDIRHDPSEAIRRRIPGAAPDLSVAAFDAHPLDIPGRRDPWSLWLRARRRLEVAFDRG